MPKPTITIFGQGRVGKALIKSLEEGGYNIVSVYNRSSFPKKVKELGEIVFLTVQDREIESLSKKIASSFSDLSNTKFVHCSGSFDASVLKDLSGLVGGIASFHPLKAITENDHSFKGVWFDMEGDRVVLKELNSIAKDLEAHTFEIKPEAKPLLHAAAVFSANYVVTIMNLAVQIAEVGDIDQDEAIKALLPLTESSISNIKSKGFEDALTGPIARGDLDTVKRHVKSLKEHPELLSVYKKLGSLTVDIAQLDDESKKKLKALLN